VVHPKPEVHLDQEEIQNMSCETRRTKFPLSLSLAALFVVLAFGGGQLALAHTDPPGSDSTGITISLTAYWDADSSGTCSAGDATVISRGSFEVQPGELICYRSTLSWGGGTNAAFEGGTWTITLPSGGVVNVVPVTPIPCIGGTFNDPTPPVPGVGQCLGSPSFIISNFAPYTVNAAHESGAPLRLRAQTDYANGRAHLSAGDLTPVSASTPFALDAVTCNATLLKQVDCGDGAGWQDACSTVNGNPVQARYTITNTGELPLACTLGDDNPFFVPQHQLPRSDWPGGITDGEFHLQRRVRSGGTRHGHAQLHLRRPGGTHPSGAPDGLC
jgi:hypothetical protein